MPANDGVLAVAHRAGNSLEELERAVDLGADVVEADVHSARGRLEVRHLKSMGPVPYLWDRWELVPTSVPQLRLPELLAAMDPRVTLMLDLKGIGPVGGQVARMLHAREPEQPLVVCARWWPSVEPFVGSSWARPVLSARNRAELARLRRRLRRRAPYGVSVHRTLLDRTVVAGLRERVDRVLTWPVDDPGTLEHVLRLGVNGIITNVDDVLRAVVAERRAG